MARHRSAQAVMSKVDIRPMVAGDADMVLGWRNDPFIVARSTSQRQVSREEHFRWVGAAVEDPSRLCLIILVDGAPAGHLRFDRAGAAAMVTVYLLEPFTGEGAGVRALTEAIPLAFGRWAEIGTIEALVRRDNAAGRKAFLKAGFASAGETGDGHEKFLLGRNPNETAAGWQSDTEWNRAYYTASNQKFGIDVRASDWSSRASQAARFDVLAKIGDIRAGNILDVGCGQGDLYDWLRLTGHRGGYVGIDVTPAMIAAASKRFPGVQFRNVDLMGERDPSDLAADWVFASGIFTFRRAEPQRYLEAMVARMFSLARKGLAFNSLSAWADRRQDGEFMADPMQVLAFCRMLTPRVALRHDYHPGDFTIYMLAGDQQACP
jgi:RimJ/RimL family protein N-acetyltransferase/SAM-dependent methyltransferase